MIARPPAAETAPSDAPDHDVLVRLGHGPAYERVITEETARSMGLAVGVVFGALGVMVGMLAGAWICGGLL